MTTVGRALRLAAIAAATFSNFALSAATRTWTGGGDGLRWSDPLNWEGGACPTNGMMDVVVLSNPGTTPTISNDLGTVSLGSIAVTSGNLALVGDPIAFDGSQGKLIDASQSLTLSIANDLTLLANNRGFDLELPTSFVLSGSLTAYEPTVDRVLSVYARSNNQSATISGDVVMPGWTIKNVVKTGGHVEFSGGLTCKALTPSGGSIGGDTGSFWLNSANPSFSEVRAGFSSVKCLRVGTIAPEAVVSFGGYSQSNYSIIDLDGKDQTCNRVVSTGNVNYWCSGNYIRSTGEARLTMNGTEDALTCCEVDGAITLVWNPGDPHVQTFSNRVNTTTGDIVVSNGTFAVAGAASFANVQRIVVADGATFDLSTTLGGSLAAVREIVVGRNAAFLIGDAVPNPFSDNTLSISLDETSELRVGANVSAFLVSMSIGGVEVEGGDYTGGTVPQITGTGTLSTPEVEVPTKDQTWTAGADPDDSVQNADNWSTGFEPTDLRSRGLRPLFATGGTKATIDIDVDFKGVRFSLPDSEDDLSFTLAGAGGSTMKLRSLGLTTVSRAGSNHIDYVLDVPVVLKEVEQTWSLADGNATVRLLKPMSGAASVSKTGAGKLELYAPNNAFVGGFSAAGGTLDVYAPSNGLGSALASTAVELDAREAKYTFHGVHESRAINVRRDSMVVDASLMSFAADTTNVLSGVLSFLPPSGSAKVAGGFSVGLGAVVVTEGEVFSGGPSGKSGSGTWICRGPLKYNQLLVVGGAVRLETTVLNRGDGVQPLVRVCGSSARFVCTIDNQLNDAWNTLDIDDGVFDLNGFSQRVGGLTVNDAQAVGGFIHSDEPATLTVVGNGISDDTVMILTVPDITGAVSFNGPTAASRTFTVNRDVSSTGSITVPGGTFAFTSAGSWRNAARVDVTGTGRLSIAASRTLGSKAVVSVAGTGTVTLAAGVRQKCAELWIGGEKCAPGAWGGSGSGAPNVSASLAGAGVFEVGMGGFVLLVR